jgi:hypothetical protein
LEVLALAVVAGCAAAFLGGAVIACDPARGMLDAPGRLTHDEYQGMTMIKRILFAALMFAGAPVSRGARTACGSRFRALERRAGKSS